MPKIPSLNPYLAPSVICPNCGDVVHPETVAMGKGRISEVRYYCVNEEKDCGWSLNVSLQHAAGEISGVKPEDLDKRREAARELKEFKGKGDATIRELIAMAPSLKQLVRMLIEDQAKTEPPAPPAGGQLGAAPTTESTTEPSAPVAGDNPAAEPVAAATSESGV